MLIIEFPVALRQLRLQPGVDKAKSAFDAKLEERNANQKKIDDKMEAKDKAKAVNDENDDDDADSLFGEDDDEAEEGEAGGDADGDGDVDMDAQDDAGVCRLIRFISSQMEEQLIYAF